MPALLTRQNIGLLVGPLLAAALLSMPQPAGMSPAAISVAAVACLMAVWWITEAAPIAATALLPIVLFPLLGVMKTADVTGAYANHLIYLFLGGFLIAVTMQKWNLHRRIAMHTLRVVGVSPARMVLGFMLATAMLSMWISNTATAMMMLPIGLAVIAQLGQMRQTPQAQTGRQCDVDRFGTCLMLGIAYAASIGGVATLIGTPPNAILAGMVEKLYGLMISFADWMLFGLPLATIMLVVCYFYLTRIAYPVAGGEIAGARQLIRDELHRIGPMTREERWVLAVFASVSAGWILRGLLDVPALAMVSDASIAMAGAILLFVIPSDLRQREFLLDWQTAVGIPWDIIILFGGGFALAQGFQDSGLSLWIAEQLRALEGASLLVMIGLVTLTVIFLTEVTSNTATATLMVPVMGALATTIGLHPYSLMVPAAIAASFAFMLPVATPPNAIVFSSRYITIPQMARTGFWLNLAAVLVISIAVLYLLPWLWGIELVSQAGSTKQ